MSLDPQQQANFEKALAFVLAQEGGFSDDPSDHGGATNLGIIQREYDAYRKSLGKPAQSVKAITHDEATAIYMQNYWLAAHCGLCHWPACLAVFDSAVNCGVGQAVKFIQRALMLTVDGVCGPKTQTAMAMADQTKLRNDICDQRAAFYHSIAEHPGQDVFLRGWLNRIAALRTT